MAAQGEYPVGARVSLQESNGIGERVNRFSAYGGVEIQAQGEEVGHQNNHRDPGQQPFVEPAPNQQRGHPLAGAEHQQEPPQVAHLIGTGGNRLRLAQPVPADHGQGHDGRQAQGQVGPPPLNQSLLQLAEPQPSGHGEGEENEGDDASDGAEVHAGDIGIEVDQGRHPPHDEEEQEADASEEKGIAVPPAQHESYGHQQYSDDAKILSGLHGIVVTPVWMV